jgi:TPP-dependent pyruvate/acetoin dehydrogenase alpha subunit
MSNADAVSHVPAAALEDPLAALERMTLIRRFEERTAELFRTREIRGTVHHASIGQEAPAVGVALHRHPEDLMFSSHRGLAHCLAWGADPVRTLAEVLGRRGGYAGGLGGHLHIVDLERGIAGTNGIVGAGPPMAVGAAQALQLRGTDGCAVTFFGDGAVNTGALAEALNLAGAWSVPVLFVCENNGLAEMTYSAGVTSGTVLDRARSYAIRAEQVDGDDVAAVAALAGDLLAEMRATGRPAFLECLTFRKEGHWIGDPEHYRDELEKSSFARRDPLIRLMASSSLGEDDAARVEAAVGERLDRVFAEVLAMDKVRAEDVLVDPVSA